MTTTIRPARPALCKEMPQGWWCAARQRLWCRCEGGFASKLVGCRHLYGAEPWLFLWPPKQTLSCHVSWIHSLRVNIIWLIKKTKHFGLCLNNTGVGTLQVGLGCRNGFAQDSYLGDRQSRLCQAAHPGCHLLPMGQARTPNEHELVEREKDRKNIQKEWTNKKRQQKTW